VLTQHNKAGSIAAWWNLKFVHQIPRGAVQRYFARLDTVWGVDESLVVVEGPFDVFAFDGDVRELSEREVEMEAGVVLPPPPYVEEVRV
jgi:hypothetical protein